MKMVEGEVVVTRLEPWQNETQSRSFMLSSLIILGFLANIAS